MSRPQYSFKGMLRACQMDTESVFVFTEGINCDPYFVASLIKHTPKNKNTSVKLRRCHELENPEGGKQKLISFFNTLSSESGLVSDFKGKKTLFVFFLDKDIDHLTNTALINPHVIYTQEYNTENDIVKNANIITAISSACSIEEARIPAVIRENPKWYNEAHIRLKEWLLLCLLVQIYRIHGHPSFSLFTPIHDNNFIQIPNEFESRLNTLKINSGMPDSEFNEVLAKTKKYLDKLLATKKGGTVFNGKWYFQYLEKIIENSLGDTPYDKKGFLDRLRSTCMATLNFKSAWTGYYRNQFNSIFELHGF